MNKFKKGDKVKFTEEAQKNISQASGDINRIKEVISYDDEHQPLYRLYDQLNEYVCYTEDCFVSANSFDEKTKIKDLIPEGYKITGITNWKNRDYSCKILFATIEIKEKEKSFEDYVEEYGGTFFDIEKEDMEGKLGLLWYIIKDKGGDYSEFVELLENIEEQQNYVWETNSIAQLTYNLLPSSFIESIRNE